MEVRILPQPEAHVLETRRILAVRLEGCDLVCLSDEVPRVARGIQCVGINVGTVRDCRLSSLSHAV